MRLRTEDDVRLLKGRTFERDGRKRRVMGHGDSFGTPLVIWYEFPAVYNIECLAKFLKWFRKAKEVESV